ncbi:hypothetical protein [Microbulbifer aestuariivivens]|uniref:hypothetical protein n=1 Tax=Microbulbifer aestuariivivens TaxID=1908308 RepID=UPI0031EFD5AA
MGKLSPFSCCATKSRYLTQAATTGVKTLMKKCCNRFLIPNIKYKASIIDSIGLTILLSFFLGIAFLVAWLGAASLVSSVEDGSISERGVLRRRTIPGGVIVLVFLYYLLPKFINACSYLISYKLKISSICKSCGEQHELASYSKSDDPF